MNAAQARTLSEDHSDQSYLATMLRSFVFPVIEAAARRGYHETRFHCQTTEEALFMKDRLTAMGYGVKWGSLLLEGARKEMVISW